MSHFRLNNGQSDLSLWILCVTFIALVIFISKLYAGDNIPIISVLFPDTGEVPTTPFLSTHDTKLYVNGELYQFVGVNAFNLGSYPPTNVGCGGPQNNLEAYFSQLRPNSTVRMWAYQGSITTNPVTKQTDWTGLDRVVNAATENGVKLILVLSDQSGTCDDGHWKDKSWYAGGYRQAFNDLGNGLTPIPYIDYVKLVVTRYKDSPTIAMWEPINEPEASDCQGATGSACFAKNTCDEVAATTALRSFFDTVGAEIKNIDKNHIISSGAIGSGQCGASYENYKHIHESPGIDVASYHDYGNNDTPMPGDVWNGLQKRLNQMKQINKPLIVGEVGMQAKDNTPGCIDYGVRRDKFKNKMDAQFAAGIAGFIPWALTGGVSPNCNYDIVDNDPTIVLLRDYPVSMGTVLDTKVPSAPTNLTASANSHTSVALNWTASTDNVGVVRYDIFRNNAYLTSTTGTGFINSNLKLGATYSYHVKGKDAAGNNSESSNTVTITPYVDTEAPTAPILIAISPTQITLTWKASTDNVGVVRYDIFRNNSYITSTTGTSITVAGLSPSTTYTFHIKGKDAAGNNSGASNVVTVTTPGM